VTINSTAFDDAEGRAKAAVHAAFATYGSQDNTNPLDTADAKDFSRSVGIPASTRSGHVWRWSETDSDWFRHPIIRSANVICTQMGIRVGREKYCACCHGPTFRTDQREVFDSAAPEPGSLKEPISSSWLMGSPAPDMLEVPAQPVTDVADKQTGFAFGLKPSPVRHDRNYRHELTARSKFREEIRHDASAFERKLPPDILHRVLRNSDEADGRAAIAVRQTPEHAVAWMRQEAAAESGWPVFQNMLANVEAGNAALGGKHPPPPSLRKMTLSPGLVVAADNALNRGIAEGHPIVEIGGILISLRRSDRPR
jgi:hypothetical protein